MITRSLTREARKAIMYFGCENGTPTVQRQERSHGLANGVRVIVRGEGKQRGRHEGWIIIRHIAMETRMSLKGFNTNEGRWGYTLWSQ